MRTFCLLASLVILSNPACGGGDETAGIDRAKVEAAPTKFKDTCESVCDTADTIRAKNCGQTEFSTHEACYLHCVDDYLRRPECEPLFDEAFDCLNRQVCTATTSCVGPLIVAAACRDGQLKPSP